MIKLERPPEPDILAQNKTQWIADLQEQLKQFKMNKVPAKFLGDRYGHQDVKATLVASSHEKCAYCEGKPGGTSYLTIDHFEPKSRYPELTFDWKNLLPVCPACNSAKGNHDTRKEPLINPYEVDPETVFFFEDIDIKPVSESALYYEAKLTIDVCNLNNLRLLKPRAELWAVLKDYIHSLEEAIKEYSSQPDSQKQRKLRNIQKAISRAESTCAADQPYAGFCRSFLHNNKVYQNAKKLV